MLQPTNNKILNFIATLLLAFLMSAIVIGGVALIVTLLEKLSVLEEKQGLGALLVLPAILVIFTVFNTLVNFYILISNTSVKKKVLMLLFFTIFSSVWSLAFYDFDFERNNPSYTISQITPEVHTDSSGNEVWDKYYNSVLGLEFSYPSSWNFAGQPYGVLVNVECQDTNDIGNIVELRFDSSTSRGLTIDGVSKESCTNRGLGWYHFAEKPSDVEYSEILSYGSNKFYYALKRGNPGVHVMVAYYFGDVNLVPSLSFRYRPSSLDDGKEYTGAEEDYLAEKEIFEQILASVKIVK